MLGGLFYSAMEIFEAEVLWLRKDSFSDGENYKIILFKVKANWHYRFAPSFWCPPLDIFFRCFREP